MLNRLSISILLQLSDDAVLGNIVNKLDRVDIKYFIR